MALFPRYPLAFPDVILQAAYNRVIREPTESNVRALCGGYLAVYFTRQEGFLLTTEKYYPSTQSQSERAGHKYFKIDYANEALKPAGTFVTHLLCECKPPKLSMKEEEEAMATFEKLARACLRTEKTDFVWAIQFYGLQITIKKFDIENGFVHQDDFSPDFVDVIAYDAHIASKFVQIKAMIPSRIVDRAARQNPALTDRRQHPLPRGQPTTVGEPTTRSVRNEGLPFHQPQTHGRGGGAPTRESHQELKFQTLTEVDAPSCRHQGQLGRKVTISDKQVFVRKDYWVQKVIRGHAVYYCEKVNAYTRAS